MSASARCRVLVTSDTHLVSGAGLPTGLLEMAEQADHIVHAGDLNTLDVLAVLREFAPVTAVHGNICDSQVAERLPLHARVSLGGVRIGIVHDAGPDNRRRTRLEALFPDCSIAVFGHTHQPVIERRVPGQLGGGMLLLNPGSPVQRRRAPHHTAAWLELGGGDVLAADLVRIDR